MNELLAELARDLEDARSIVRKHPGLDRAYVLGWLEQFDRDLGTATVQAFSALGAVKA